MNSSRTRFNDPTPGVQRSTAETTGKSGRPTLAVRRAGFNPAPYLTLPWASASHDTGSPLARDAVTRVKTGNPTAGYPRDTQISMGLMRLVGSTTPQDSDLAQPMSRLLRLITGRRSTRPTEIICWSRVVVSTRSPLCPVHFFVGQLASWVVAWYSVQPIWATMRHCRASCILPISRDLAGPRMTGGHVRVKDDTCLMELSGHGDWPFRDRLTALQVKLPRLLKIQHDTMVNFSLMTTS